jgi:hypothetical protein
MSKQEEPKQETLDVKKCEEIFILIKLAKLTLTEINTLSDEERSILTRWFKESAEREQRIMKQYNLRNDYGQ